MNNLMGLHHGQHLLSLLKQKLAMIGGQADLIAIQTMIIKKVKNRTYRKAIMMYKKRMILMISKAQIKMMAMWRIMRRK